MRLLPLLCALLLSLPSPGLAGASGFTAKHAVDAQGIVYALRPPEELLHRWSLTERRALDALPLRSSPVSFAYSPVHGLLYVQYEGGPGGGVPSARANTPPRQPPFEQPPSHLDAE
jgi:hypothetical protein